MTAIANSSLAKSAVLRLEIQNIEIVLFEDFYKKYCATWYRKGSLVPMSKRAFTRREFTAYHTAMRRFKKMRKAAETGKLTFIDTEINPLMLQSYD